MSKERLTAEETLEENGVNIDLLQIEAEYTYKNILLSMQSFAAQEVAEATKDMYPKAFYRWKENNVIRIYNGYVYNYDNLLNGARWKHVDEMFEYWKQNISKRKNR